ncbi:ras-responsive element-binding protein 1-like [Macrosteles quadrilineatus]|uniref:ras-responsive element-binding protein 1-like n=1 Tax=Macrosteles quadrilineatus TaxID=74068 RepID=UPI0023E34852|nr:ras-responsive element-binding protein 1-like [Macrosteles quadrilineatus]
MQDTPCETGFSPAPAPTHEVTLNPLQVPRMEKAAEEKPLDHDTKEENQAKETHSTDEDNPVNNNTIQPPNQPDQTPEVVTKQADNFGDVQYGCPVCDMVLFSSHDFTIHIRSHKPEDLGFISSSGKSLVCQICCKVMTSEASLDKHILTHSREQQFKCKICGTMFTSIGTLHYHMRSHSSENRDSYNYDSDASSESLGSPKSFSSLPTTQKRRRVSRTASEYNNNVIEFSPYRSEHKRKTEDDFGSSKRKKSEKSKFDCSFCGKTGFLSLNLLETHIEECHPDYVAKCTPCNLVFKNHRVLNLHRYMVHHSELKERSVGNVKETIGFKDLTFVDFSSEKFPHIARAMCEQSLHLASSMFHRFQCDKCSRAFPCGSALNIHRQGCGQENYASSGESCHQDNDFSSSDEAPTDLSSAGKRGSWSETKVSESSDDVEEERKRFNFFAGLDLQNKSIANTPPQTCPPTSLNLRRDLYFNQNNSESKDLADIQSIISVTSAGGLLHDLSKSPQPTVLEVTPPDSGSRAGTFESAIADEEQQDCFAAEFRKMKLRGEFPCRLCKAIFPNLRALKGHNRVHLTSSGGANPVPYRCNMCPHYSSDKSALIRHMRTHNGDRPYECALCHYAFTTKANCERHLRNRHAKMTREDVKKSIIYHPSEDPTNDADHKPNRDDVKRSLFSESDQLNRIESKDSFKIENTHSFTKQNLETPNIVFEKANLPKASPFAYVQKAPSVNDITVNETVQRKCLDVGTMTQEENDVRIPVYHANTTPDKTDSDTDAPLDLSMDVLDLSKKKATPREQPIISKNEVFENAEELEPQDLSKKPNIPVEKRAISIIEPKETITIQRNIPETNNEDKINTSAQSPHPTYENENPVLPNPLTKLDLSKFYPANAHPFYLNANAPFPAFTPTVMPNGSYPPYFIPPPPGFFPGNSGQDFVEIKERLQKELIRGLQLTSGGSLVLDQLAMVNAADRIQSLQQQAMAEYNWRIENSREERTFSPSMKEKIPVHESEKDTRTPEINHSKLQEKLAQPKPKQETSSSVKMVIKNGVLIPKQKQRRYRTERPFSCEHCAARFTLRSNMERHIKQQHPQYWSQRQRNAITMPARRNHSIVPKVPQSLLNHSQYYSQSGMPNMSIKSEEDSKSSINSDFNADKFTLEGKPCISEEVKNAIALQLKSKIPSSESVNGKNEELMEEEEDEDLVIDEEKNDEVDDQDGEQNEEEISFRKKMCMREDSADLASVSRLLDNASTQTFRQYFHSEEDQPGGDGSDEDEEGLVAAGSASEGCNSGSDENRSESENNSTHPPAVKKKSAYSMAPNRVSCPYCARKFPWSSSLRRHVLTHTGQKPYKCSFCPLLFTTKSNCDRHLLRKHGGGTPTTTEVPPTVTEQPNGPNYTMRNVPERPYKCKNCPSSTFSTLSNLKKHLSTKHQPGAFKNDQSGYESHGSASEEIDVCDEVKDEEKEKRPITDLREIHPSHTESHTFKQETFVATPSDLPFKCHLCEGSFAERQEALDHIRDSHSSEFQLLVSKGALEVGAAAEENHPTEENGEENLEQLRGKFPDYANRKVMCAFCLRRFWSAEDLRRHMRTHTGERPFSCDICRRRFTLKHSMLRHRKKHSFPAPEDTSPASDEETAPNNNNNNYNTILTKHWAKSRMEEDSDLISNLLGIQDKTIVDKMLLSKSAEDAAKLLGVKK